jgi:hypothetical protein
MLQKYKNDFLLMLESGFVAINQTDADSAKKLFQAAHLLKPESAFPHVGFAFLFLHLLELSKAIAACEDALRKEPNNEMAKTLMGICKTMTLKQSQEGEKILVEMTHSHNPDIKRAADTGMDFVEKFVKKAPSPVELSKPKKNKEKRK